MFLKKLTAINYKNFSSVNFEFDHKINCFVGNNGVGKTNTLDAIHLLSFGRSYFNPIAKQNIRYGEDFFMVEGQFERKKQEERIVCSLKLGQKKTIKRNGKTYDRLSEHIGLIPSVIVSPADSDLIWEGSDTRRRLMNLIIAQSNKEYLSDLISYNQALAQRNALLKFFAANASFDADTLAIYNQQLVTFGNRIFKARTKFIAQFTPVFEQRYKAITQNNEAVAIRYKSQLQKGPLNTLLLENLKKDSILQYSSVGIHKDDLMFLIDGYPIKKFGSQGQQKSFLIALKFAQFDLVKEQIKTTPILLLDDIFDKLDQRRVSHIIKLVDKDDFGQIFISDTHLERTEKTVKEIHQSYKIFRL